MSDRIKIIIVIIFMFIAWLVLVKISAGYPL